MWLLFAKINFDSNNRQGERLNFQRQFEHNEADSNNNSFVPVIENYEISMGEQYTLPRMLLIQIWLSLKINTILLQAVLIKFSFDIVSHKKPRLYIILIQFIKSKSNKELPFLNLACN